MTKKELITLLREDIKYQREHFSFRESMFIRINGITIYIIDGVRVRFKKNYVDIGYRNNVIAHICYSDIRTVGYLYDDSAVLDRRLAELRFDSQCSREV